nr:MAG TPA: hypothetical protein [Caudoviricetes sp.]
MLRVFYRLSTKESGARPPSLFGSVRVIFLSGYAAPCLLPVTARLENLKFRSSKTQKPPNKGGSHSYFQTIA